MPETTKTNFKIATFAAGCFWHVEEIFRQVKGVQSTAVGFMGGIVENPSYEQVCTGNTGHAEVVQLTYNPAEVSYEELLCVFWNSHNPTTPNRQGPDIGTRYRSIIFFHTSEQASLAKKSKEECEKSKKYQAKIVTEIIPASTFYKAEEYHQKYLLKGNLKACPMYQ